MNENSNDSSPRIPDHPIDPMFIDRWSPRAFLGDPLTQQEIDSLFEAARFAPSAFNEQPWVFAFARTPEDRAQFVSALSDRNKTWASRAPLLLFVLARRKFARNGKENRHAAFDAGAAWMALALQARKLGLYTHAMAGFSVEKAQGILGVNPEDYLVIAAIAVGRKGDPATLPDDLRAIEAPNERKSISAFVFEMKVK